MAGRAACALLVVLLLLHVCGIGLFTQGFFLTRLELRSASTCYDVSGTVLVPVPSIGIANGDAGVHAENVYCRRTRAESASDRTLQNGASQPACTCDAERKSCWNSALYGRLVLIVIDAWRHDFASWRGQLPSKSAVGRTSGPTVAAEAIPFTNQMPLLASRLANNRSHARLYKFEADPPTVTMQRLKGLTSGSLPTFIDLSSNFASSAILEDNIIAQAAASSSSSGCLPPLNRPSVGNHRVPGCSPGQNGKRMVFMGDDTWVGLFPTLFGPAAASSAGAAVQSDAQSDGGQQINGSASNPSVRSSGRHRHLSFPYPSFDVKDLHTVDNGVIEHLLPTLRGDGYCTGPGTSENGHTGVPGNTISSSTCASGDRGWDVTIAHFLGVDHVGHRHGPSHPAMTSKLNQMDGVLQSVVDELERQATPPSAACEPGADATSNARIETCSDVAHPAPPTLLVVLGDHGMSSSGNHGGASADETGAALYMHSFGRPLFSDVYLSQQHSASADGSAVVPLVSSTVSQVDIVPTLSLALGLPIPHASLGAVIDDVDWTDSACLAAGDDDAATLDADVEGTAVLLRRLAMEHARTRAYALNAFQVTRYLSQYSAIAQSFGPVDVAEIMEAYEQGMDEYSHILRLLTELASSAGDDGHQAAPDAAHGRLRTDSRSRGSEDMSGPDLGAAAQIALDIVTSNRRQLHPQAAAEVASILQRQRALQLRFRSLITRTSDMCRRLWTQFDPQAMIWGIVILVGAVAITLHAVFGSAPLGTSSSSPVVGLVTIQPAQTPDDVDTAPSLSSALPRTPAASAPEASEARKLQVGAPDAAPLSSGLRQRRTNVAAPAVSSQHDADEASSAYGGIDIGGMRISMEPSDGASASSDDRSSQKSLASYCLSSVGASLVASLLLQPCLTASTATHLVTHIVQVIISAAVAVLPVGSRAAKSVESTFEAVSFRISSCPAGSTWPSVLNSGDPQLMLPSHLLVPLPAVLAMGIVLGYVAWARGCARAAQLASNVVQNKRVAGRASPRRLSRMRCCCKAAGLCSPSTWRTPYFTSVGLFVLLVLRLWGLFTNSFIVAEARMAAFLLGTASLLVGARIAGNALTYAASLKKASATVNGVPRAAAASTNTDYDMLATRICNIVAVCTLGALLCGRLAEHGAGWLLLSYRGHRALMSGSNGTGSEPGTSTAELLKGPIEGTFGAEVTIEGGALPVEAGSPVDVTWLHTRLPLLLTPALIVMIGWQLGRLKSLVTMPAHSFATSKFRDDSSQPLRLRAAVRVASTVSSVVCCWYWISQSHGVLEAGSSFGAYFSQIGLSDAYLQQIMRFGSPRFVYFIALLCVTAVGYQWHKSSSAPPSSSRDASGKPVAMQRGRGAVAAAALHQLQQKLEAGGLLNTGAVSEPVREQTHDLRHFGQQAEFMSLLIAPVFPVLCIVHGPWSPSSIAILVLHGYCIVVMVALLGYTEKLVCAVRDGAGAACTSSRTSDGSRLEDNDEAQAPPTPDLVLTLCADGSTSISSGGHLQRACFLRNAARGVLFGIPHAAPLMLHLFSVHAFHASGHAPQFSSLSYASAFVGFETFNFVISGLLLAINTFGASHLLSLVMLLPMLVSFDPMPGNVNDHVAARQQHEAASGGDAAHAAVVDRIRCGWGVVVAEGASPQPTSTADSSLPSSASCTAYRVRALVLSTLVFSMSALCTCIFCFIVRRELMVWAIFAPKFCFEAVGLLLADLCVITAAVLVT